jgi:hypothetical protein
MMRICIVAFTVVAHLVGCAQLPQVGPDRSLSAEERVYLDLLTAYSAQSPPRVRIVSDSTEGPIQPPSDSTGLGAFGELVEQLPADLVASFVLRRNDRVGLSSNVLARLPDGVIVRSSIAGELSANPDDGIFRLPDGRGASVSTFSRVGFDSSGEQALVHEQWACGPRCGGTSLILMAKDMNGRWNIVERKRGWVF